MNLLDAALVVAALLSLTAGWRLGLVARVAAWVGLVLGLGAAWLAVPAVLSLPIDAGPLLRFALTVGTAVIAVSVVSSITTTIGSALTRRVRGWRLLGRLDRLAGAVASVALLAMLVWFLAPIAATVPGAVSRQVRNSAAVAALAERAPPPPDTAALLRRLVDTSGFPTVLADLEPAPIVGPPPNTIEVAPDALSAASRATVRIGTTGCDRRMSGTGFVADDGLVVTNAHVVAGAETVRIHRDDGVQLDARIVSFDPVADLALLEVPGIDRRPITLGEAAPDAVGAVIGHPAGQVPQRIAAMRVDQQREAVGRDIYDRGSASRRILILAADLQRGDSGAPVLDGQGRAIGVVFAVSPDRPATAFALDQPEVLGLLDGPRRTDEAARCPS